MGEVESGVGPDKPAYKRARLKSVIPAVLVVRSAPANPEFRGGRAVEEDRRQARVTREAVAAEAVTGASGAATMAAGAAVNHADNHTDLKSKELQLTLS